MVAEGLLAQIRAAPSDDALRMVYADALLARGDERGEYIQLDLARARQRRLTREQRARWMELHVQQGRWAAALGCGSVKVLWRRGLPYAVAGTVPEVLAARGVMQRLPITSVVLTVTTETDAIAALPELAWIDELVLDKPERDTIEPSHLAALCAGHLDGLRSLSFRPDAMRDRFAPLIAAASWFGQLTTLEVNNLTGRGVERLLETPPDLRRLAIGSSILHEVGARVLAGVHLPSLDDLTLYGAGLRSHLRVALANPRLAALRRLWISDEWLAGVELPPLPNVVDLGLSNAVLDDLAPLLARAWPRLVTLDLSSNPIRDPGAAALARSDAFPALARLSLMNTQIRHAGAVAFKHRTGLPALEELWLGSVHVTDDTWHDEDIVRTWFEGTNLVVL